MTSGPHPAPSPDDVAISAAVEQLLEARGESVVDLSHYTRISVASLYRKLGGQQSWKAADVGALARHYGIDPGALFGGQAVPVAVPVQRPVVADALRHPFSA